jgi:DNA polymerase-4
MQTIFHLDLDTFFVSVERILDPSLEGKPVIVGADPHGRGVISACSYEARKFGLHSAMPIGRAYKLCPQGIYLRGHFSEYVHYSKGVKAILEKYAPALEQASIDEFYMDFSGCEKIYGTYPELARFLQREIKNRLQLPSSIGIGSNKNIAKIGSDYNKPMGVTYVTAGKEKEFLAQLAVEKMPGVGKVTLKDLRAKGIYTIGDIAKLPMEYFSTDFGKAGIDLWKRANGAGTEYLTIEREQKSMSKETTFETDVIDKGLMERTLFELTGKVSQTLRNHNFMASTISIKLRYSDFQTIDRARTIQPTDDDKIIYETALELFRKAYTRRVSVRLIGIHLSKFSQFAEQGYLFETSDEKRKKMLDAINLVRAKYGFGSVKLGSAGKETD